MRHLGRRPPPGWRQTGYRSADNFAMVSQKNSIPVWAAAAATVCVSGGVFYYMWSPSQSTDAVQTSGSGARASQSSDGLTPGAAGAVSPASAAQAASRFKVHGIVSSGGQGLALIAVDGRPARTYRVGDTVDGNLVLLSVSANGVTLGSRDGGATLALEASPMVSGDAAAAAQVAPRANVLPKGPLNDGSARAQETLRQLGARHAPIVAQPQPAPKKPAAETTQPVDDGRWRPATKP